VDEVATGTAREATTLARLLWDRAAAAPDDVAYRHRVGRPGRRAWEDVTWAHARGLVEPLAAGLVTLDVGPGDRVALLSVTRVDAVLGHLAVLCAGATTVVVDPGSSAPEVARVVHGSGAVVVLAEDLAQVEKLRVVRGDIRTVRKVVLLDGVHRDRRVMTLEALLRDGEDLLAREPDAVDARIHDLGPDSPATLLPGDDDATSGGVVRTHGDWVAAGVEAGPRAPGAGGDGSPGPSLTDPAGHARLAAQLAHGFVSIVDGPLDG
jgi:long-chain acyl-CoA synthetase